MVFETFREQAYCESKEGWREGRTERKKGGRGKSTNFSWKTLPDFAYDE